MYANAHNFNTFGLSARAHGAQFNPLSMDQLRLAVPSAFADEAAADRSSRYRFIPTQDVVMALQREGFYPVAATEQRARIEERHGKTKHLIRFRREAAQAVGDVIPEIALVNSHDGTTSYQLSGALMRLACLNGLIVSDSCIETIKVRHSGNVIDDVIEGTYSIIEQTPKAIDSAENMRAIALRDDYKRIFAKAALQLRYDADESPIEADQLLRVKRMDDRKDDLWTTFNRVQENLIRGGLRGRNANGGRTTTREIKSVSENVRLNRALWTLAEEMAKLAA